MQTGKTKIEGVKTNSKREIPLSLASPSLPAAVLAVQYLCRCSAAFICCLFSQTSCFSCAYVCMSLPPNYICQTPRDITWKTFPPPPSPPPRLYLHWHCAGGAPPSLLLPIPSLSSLNSSSTPVLCLSLPQPTILLRPIITRSTSLLQLPWQQLCWAQVLHVARGHHSTTDHHHLLH